MNSNKNTIVLVLILFVVLIGAVFLLGNNKDTVNENEVVIGFVTSSTGDAAVDAFSMERGARLATKILNKEGVKVRLILEDDGTSPEKSVSAALKLIGNKEVDALLGFTWSFLLESAASVIDSGMIPTYSPTNTSEYLSVDSPYIFKGAVKNEKKLEPLKNLLLKKEITKVAIVVNKSGWADNHIDIWTRAVEAVDGEVVLMEEPFFGSESQSVPTIVSKIKNSGAEVVLSTGGQALSVILPNKMAEQGVNIPIYGVIGYQTAIDNGEVKEPEGVDWYVYKNKVNDEFRELFEEEYGEAPGLYAESAFDGIMLLVEAARKSDGTREGITRYLQNDLLYKGFATTYSFDEHGDIESGDWFLVEVE